MPFASFTVSRTSVFLLNPVVAGFSPRSTRWKQTRAKARDYMLNPLFWLSESFQWNFVSLRDTRSSQMDQLSINRLVATTV
jgi:hypothetical protein